MITRFVRVKLDFVLRYDEPVPCIPFGPDSPNKLIAEGVQSLVKPDQPLFLMPGARASFSLVPERAMAKKCDAEAKKKPRLLGSKAR